MDPHRAHCLREAHPGAEFPWHRPVAAPELREIYDAAAKAFGVNREHASNLTPVLVSLAHPLPDADAEADGFSLEHIASRHGLDDGGNVLLHQLNWNETDEMHFADVCRHFQDLWYPAADDTLILDMGLRWLIAVRHWGEVKVLKSSHDAPGG
ncbi:MAG TPA: hypothetical protein VFB66_28770 [Tepidisphaeraceae bacterium]|nr:hypothetical protein [Tepidisphaeraceae bacterium]